MDERQSVLSEALESLRLENIEPSPELVDELNRRAASSERPDALDLIVRRIVERALATMRAPQAD